MAYEETMRKMFKGIHLEIEDFYLLEDFQIASLPSFVTEREFSAVLWEYPSIKDFLIKNYFPISSYINEIQSKYSAADNQDELTTYTDKILWQIAFLIVYNRMPEIYNERADITIDFTEITSVCSLENKIVLDVGAGTGRLAFEAVNYARTVFAVEPTSKLRSYIRKKANRLNIHNLFTIDGFLDSIPLPDNFADLLLTSNAIGWQLEEELKEIDRVVKPGGYVFHLLQYPDPPKEEPYHSTLISTEWQYQFEKKIDQIGLMIKYWKKCK
ncbi:MAG: class I SAM-dependent methyltransferase [Candidatus Hodarchaeales archaeon]|jgi:ubiquinone/menaquinone biosynthesis C-methylase UbiE